MRTFTIEALDNFFILRDDSIVGGTKRRALDFLVKEIPESDIAYAGTVFGHGALALAHACQSAGKRAHLYLSSNNDHHPMIKRIQETNAVIERCEPLPVEQLHYAIKQGHVFPLGFDAPDFHAAMAEVLKELDLSPYAEIWCPTVSGTLAKSLQAAFPQMVLKTVAVAKSAPGLFQAPEKYHQTAALPPPYPSCPYTDAKVWRFVVEHARPNALIWNMAG